MGRWVAEERGPSGGLQLPCHAIRPQPAPLLCGAPGQPHRGRTKPGNTHGAPMWCSPPGPLRSRPRRPIPRRGAPRRGVRWSPASRGTRAPGAIHDRGMTQDSTQTAPCSPTLPPAPAPLAVVHSRTLVGLEAPEVRVEVQLAPGLPSFTLVGLADTEVKESRERVRAALQHSGLGFPHNRRITVNLAPADLPKDSGRFDLPIAIGVLAAAGLVDASQLARHEFAGELSLAGELRPVRGAVALALASKASGNGRTLVLPEDSARLAAQVPGLDVRSAPDLATVVAPGRTPATPTGRAHTRPGGGAGPDAGQARPGDRRGRRAQPAHGGAAGQRQVDAGAAPARFAAGAVGGRGAGRRRPARPGLQRRRADAARRSPLPHATPHRVGGGAGGRRFTAPAGRDLAGPRRRPLPRRVARVSALGTRGPARTAGDRARHPQSRRASGHLSSAVPARRGDEPLPLRSTGSARLPLQPRSGGPVPGATVRPPAGPHRPAAGGAGGAAGRVDGAGRRRDLGRRGPACGRGPRKAAAPARATQRHPRCGRSRPARRLATPRGAAAAHGGRTAAVVRPAPAPLPEGGPHPGRPGRRAGVRP